MAQNSSGSAMSPMRLGLLVLTIASVIGFADAIFNYFNADNGIHGSEGALLVVVSTALQVLAALLILFGALKRGWLKGLFEVLILLDLIGTAAAAYLLDAWVLLAFTVIAAIGWIMQLGRSRPVVAREVVS